MWCGVHGLIDDKMLSICKAAAEEPILILMGLVIWQGPFMQGAESEILAHFVPIDVDG